MGAVIPDKVDLSKYVETRLMGERPHVRGRRVPISFIASAQEKGGLSLADIADEFTISEEQVLAALLYYREHKAEIDAQDAEEIRLWNDMRERHGKKPGQV